MPSSIMLEVVLRGWGFIVILRSLSSNGHLDDVADDGLVESKVFKKIKRYKCPERKKLATMTGLEPVLPKGNRSF